MSERRYTEAEVAAIFERAARREDAGAPEARATDGMTLAQIREIGREVGISADAVEEAARAVVLSGNVSERRVLGLPLGVGRTVPLARKLTDDEWEHVVVDLRQTFDARGRTRSEGSLREWTNGNLQALLEPTATGQQLRLRTTKGQAITGLLFGASFVGMSAIGLAASVLRHGADLGRIVPLSMIGAFGVAAIGYALLPLRAWARTRKQQMEEVAGRVATLASETPPQDKG
ncbi:MAG TPA: hypothetical protein VE967_02760 [Gemmatimonadaceae bacterium]|nr:hypothetical protein [Gemmatimonadaceae bacterium]